MSPRGRKSVSGYLAKYFKKPEGDDCCDELLEAMIEAHVREIAPTPDPPNRRTCLHIFFRSRVGLVTATGLAALGLAGIAAARHAQSGPMPPRPSPSTYVAEASGRLHGHAATPTAKNKPAKKTGAHKRAPKMERPETTNRPPARRRPKPVDVTAKRRKTTITAGTPPIVKLELPKPLKITETADR